MILRVSPKRDIKIPGTDALVRFACAASMIWMSWLFLQPEVTMIGPTWVAFLRIMPEQSWGLILIAPALTGCIGVFTPRGWSRAICTSITAIAHVELARLIIVGHDPTANTTVAPGAGLFSIFAMMGFCIATWDILVAYRIIQERAFVLNFWSDQ